MKKHEQFVSFTRSFSPCIASKMEEIDFVFDLVKRMRRKQPASGLAICMLFLADKNNRSCIQTDEVKFLQVMFVSRRGSFLSKQVEERRICQCSKRERLILIVDQSFRALDLRMRWTSFLFNVGNSVAVSKTQMEGENVSELSDD